MARKSFTATKADAGSPILNGPYDPPACHYATSSDGQLNYNDPRPGRRGFAAYATGADSAANPCGEESTKVMVL